MPESPEAVVLRALLELIRQRLGSGYTLTAATYAVRGPDGVLQATQLDPRDWLLAATAGCLPPPAAAAAGSAPGSAPAHLSRMQRRILDQATARPQPAKRLIALAGYSLHTTTRAAITHLCREGYLVRLPEGLVRGPRQLA